VALHDGRLLLVDLAAGDGEVRELTRGADGEISGLAWSPDSQ
jgi:tricorn protease